MANLSPKLTKQSSDGVGDLSVGIDSRLLSSGTMSFFSGRSRRDSVQDYKLPKSLYGSRQGSMLSTAMPTPASARSSILRYSSSVISTFHEGSVASEKSSPSSPLTVAQNEPMLVSPISPLSSPRVHQPPVQVTGPALPDLRFPPIAADVMFDALEGVGRPGFIDNAGPKKYYPSAAVELSNPTTMGSACCARTMPLVKSNVNREDIKSEGTFDAYTMMGGPTYHDYLMDSQFPGLTESSPHIRSCVYENAPGIGRIQAVYLANESPLPSHPFIVLPKMLPYDIIQWMKRTGRRSAYLDSMNSIYLPNAEAKASCWLSSVVSSLIISFKSWWESLFGICVSQSAD